MKTHAFILSALVASIIVIELGSAQSALGQSQQPVPDETACEAADIPDAEYASALDAYEVRWDVFRATVGQASEFPTSQAAWRRVFDSTHDGVDSLRSAPLGAHEEVQLIARVRGPARVSFWWRAQPGTGDFVRFRYKKAEADDRYIETVGPIRQAFDWTQRDVFLEEDVDYKLVWIYNEDGNTQEDNGPGGDGLWIDQVEINAEHYRSIPFEKVRGGVANTAGPAQPSGYVELTWSTLHGRIYRLEYQSEMQGSEDESAWLQAQDPEPGDGTPMRVRELVENYKVRRYRVRMLDPPTFTSAPKERHVRLAEGAPFRLDYLAEDAAEGARRLKWIWKRWPLDGDVPVAVPNDRPTLEIASVRPEDSAEYEVQVHNDVGCEVAPRVRLEVFRKPSIEKLRWRIGDGEPVEEALSSGAASGDLLPEPLPLHLEVRPGDSLRLEADVGGAAPIAVQWERQARDTNRWGPLKRSGRAVVIDAADAEQAGSYRVVARSDWGEDLGPPIIVELLEEPTVVWLPEGEDIEVFASDIVTLSVRPTGTPPFLYIWFVDKRSVADARSDSYRPSTNLAEPHPVSATIEAHVSNATGATTPTHEIRFVVKPLEPHEISDLGLKLLPVPAGKFRMGAPHDSNRPHDEGPMRTVVLTHSYWMAETELTERQWSMVMGTPMPPETDPEVPASLTFEEAESFVAALTGRARASGNIDSGMRYAIPTEAEWERVAQREAPSRTEAGPLVATDSLRPLSVKSGLASRNGFYELFGNAWGMDRGLVCPEARRQCDPESYRTA